MSFIKGEAPQQGGGYDTCWLARPITHFSNWALV